MTASARGVALPRRVGQCPVRPRQPLRLALRARQAALGSGVSPSHRARPDRAAARVFSTSAAARACSPACSARRGGAGPRGRWPAAGPTAPTRRPRQRHRAARARRRACARRARRRRRLRLRRHAPRRLSEGRCGGHPRRRCTTSAIAEQDERARARPVGARSARPARAARRRQGSAARLRGEPVGRPHRRLRARPGAPRRAPAAARRVASPPRRARLRVSSLPMHRGTPFANVLLVGTVEGRRRGRDETAAARVARTRGDRGPDPAPRTRCACSIA